MCERTNSRRVDKCIGNLVAALKLRPDIEMLASCCGHGRYPMTLIARRRSDSVVYDLMSNKIVPRTRNFYRRDSRGFYYIPEISRPIP